MTKGKSPCLNMMLYAFRYDKNAELSIVLRYATYTTFSAYFQALSCELRAFLQLIRRKSVYPRNAFN